LDRRRVAITPSATIPDKQLAKFAAWLEAGRAARHASDAGLKPNRNRGKVSAMKRDLPAKPIRPPVTPEVLAEVLRRTEPKHLAEQEAAARPADEIMRELRQKYTVPR
jgi:hypothetical protein